MIKRFLPVLLLVAGLQAGWGFALLSPNAQDLSGFTGNPWQTIVIGYNNDVYQEGGLPGGPVALGDLGGPGNIGEGYRRNDPVIYYAYNASYSGFFGSNGMAAADSAFAIMNSLTNVSSYSSDLSEFPLTSQHLNYQAQALFLTDVKSVTLHLLVETMGLTDPERFTWTLAERVVPPGCPLTTLYLVIQRNFDIIPSSPTQIQYSSYVNNELFTYQIFEICSGNPTLAIAAPIPVDPLQAMDYTAVAANNFSGIASEFVIGAEYSGLEIGGYYAGLTRDDVGGLRYLMNAANVATENAAAGSLLEVTNAQPPQLFNTYPISLLSTFSNIDPNTLQTNYPGITIVSVQTNFVTLVNTNTVAIFIGIAPPYTNQIPALTNGAAVFPTNGIVLYTNWSNTQYGNPPLLIDTFPLGLFLQQYEFLSPNVIQNFYPGLLWDSEVSSLVVTTNYVPYYTNQSVLPVFTNQIAGGLPNVTTLTNIYFFTNQPGPTVINYDRTQPFTTISTLDLGAFSDLAQTNNPGTMQVLYPGLQILRATTSPAFILVTNYISYLTNQFGSPYQGPPVLVTKAASSGYVWVTNWTYTFGNVFTNHYYTNRLVTVQSIWITNRIGAPYGSPTIAVTNSVTYKTNLVSGDFFLIPTNWCGFDLTLSFPLGNPPYQFGPTNTVIYSGYATNGSTGTNNVAGGNSYGLTQNFYDLYTNYNYAVYPGICEPVVQFAAVTNIQFEYNYHFINIVTNHYYTNSYVQITTTNSYTLPGGSPDLVSNAVVTTTIVTDVPDGDFYIVPTNWCGYEIQFLTTNVLTYTNVVNAVTNNSSGVQLQNYTQSIFTYTNYSTSIRPGVCEPVLAFTNTISTNIVQNYTYDLGNSIHTNSYYTNYPTYVLITNTTEIVTGTNNLVGWPLVPTYTGLWDLYGSNVVINFGFFGNAFTNFNYFIAAQIPRTDYLLGNMTNIVTIATNYNGVAGDFFIVPPQWCSYTILATQLVNNVYSSTTTFAEDYLGWNETGGNFPFGQGGGFGNVPPNIPNNGQLSYSVTTNTPNITSTLLVQPSFCSDVVAPAALRQGIERIQFVRANYDSLIGQFFQPITNFYTMVKITNSQAVTEYYRRVITQPDIVFAADNQIAANTFNGTVTRNISFDTANVLPGLAGPGVINSPVTFSFNKIGDAFSNGSLADYLLTTNQFLSELTALPVLAWASYDSSTNLPVVYPNGNSIQNLQNEILVQITPTSLANGTNNTAYPSVTFTATGGSFSPPFTWSATGLPVGMTVSSGGTLSGTPTVSGTFDITLQLTDSLGRSVQWFYTLIIQ